MAQQLFFKAETFISSRSQPIISNVEDLIPGLEADAYGHWLFGGSSASLTDTTHGKALTLQSGATVQPIYNENNVVLSSQNGSALISDLTDAAAQNTSFAAVVKTSTNGLSILVGNLVPSTATNSSSHGIFASAQKGYVTVKPQAANNSGGANSITGNGNITQTEYFFISGSFNKTTKTVIVYAERLGVSSNTQATWSATYEASANKIAVGNAYYAGAAAGTMTFAEAIIYDKALTLQQMKDLAVRSKSRMTVRGITF